MTDANIPARPSLEFDRKQAKRLLKAVTAGDRSAVARVAASHPRFRAAKTLPASISLGDMLLTIAREYGFSSWPEWKHFVELSMLEQTARVSRFLECACSDRVNMAMRLLRLDEAIGEADACAASAAGNAAALKAFIDADPACVLRNSGPLDTQPLVYACQSRLLVTD
ncbi:MAG TPA: hypothetical protein VJ998_01875, partial [Pseudomonadales bacterium]|nr:hypothetical protein [Pseudomonadales bacterium]